MSELKSHEFDGFLQKPNQLYRLFVIYGPDRGLVSERAGQIAAKSGIKLDDAFCSVTLQITDLQGGPGKLLDEVNSIGLFGGEKLVRVRGANNEKAIIEAVQILSESPPADSWLIIEAGDLKKGTGLRKIADTSRAVLAIPCYADDTRALNTLIDGELATENLRITPDARHALIELLGGDRIASRNEIRKLALYCRGQPVIEEQHVIDIVGDASATSTDDAVDAILSGNRDGLFHAAQKIITSKTPLFLVLQSCLKQFQMMDLMRAEMDEKKLSSSQVMQTLGRHIHFRRKPVIENALKTWSAPAIAREMTRLQAAIFNSRQRSTLEDSIALHTLLSTTIQSGRKA